MATPGKRSDAPKGETIDEGQVGRRGAAGASASDAPRTIPRDGSSGVGGATRVPPIVVGGDGPTTIRIEITITTGATRGDGASAPPVVPPDDATTVERAVVPWHDESYGDRRGYRATFLGPRIPLPRLRSSRMAARQRNGEITLPYQHFSIVMHATRRLPIFAAANLDGSPRAQRPDPTKRYTRDALGGLGENDTEKWFTDPRLAAEYQLSDEFFERDGQAFDKGHLVMRDTIAWGTTYTMLRRANGDSYHITNCTPQVKGFNRASQQGRWGRLEGAIARAVKGGRCSVFAGPVLSDDDWWFEGRGEGGAVVRVQIPSRYWKVVAGIGDDGALVAYGFLLTQDLSAVPLREEFGLDASAWTDEFVSIGAVEAAAGLVRLPAALVRADQFGTEAGAVLREELGYAGG